MSSVTPKSGEAATHHALAGESRQALLTFLRRENRPVDAANAGDAVGLHRNTARVHLDLLARAGLVTRQYEERAVPGRPRVLYEAARLADRDSDRPGVDAGYRELARLLADQLTEVADARNEAMRAGRRWAASLGARSLPSHALTPIEAVQVAVDILNDLGFEPEADPIEEPERILLHRCPFAEVAKDNRSVVCGIHLGMLRATFERLDTPVQVAGLDPFVTDDPLLCVVRLAVRSASSASAHRDRPHRRTDEG
jgi:predicted ArsR family transcriptional regulator